MRRLAKITVVMSGIVLLVTVTLWGVSLFGLTYIAPSRQLHIFAVDGAFVVRWADEAAASAGYYSRPGSPGFHVLGFKLQGNWRMPSFRKSCPQTMYWNWLVLPLWGPTILFGVLMCCGVAGMRRWSEQTTDRLCPSCGYNLTGNVGGVCPECGTVITEKQRAPLSSSDARAGATGKGIG